MSIPECNTSIRTAVHTNGGIRKTLLTPCRRIGLSRNRKASHNTLFISPLETKEVKPLGDASSPINSQVNEVVASEKLCRTPIPSGRTKRGLLAKHQKNCISKSEVVSATEERCGVDNEVSQENLERTKRSKKSVTNDNTDKLEVVSGMKHNVDKDVLKENHKARGSKKKTVDGDNDDHTNKSEFVSEMGRNVDKDVFEENHKKTRGSKKRTANNKDDNIDKLVVVNETEVVVREHYNKARGFTKTTDDKNDKCISDNQSILQEKVTNTENIISSQGSDESDTIVQRRSNKNINKSNRKKYVLESDEDEEEERDLFMGFPSSASSNESSQKRTVDETFEIKKRKRIGVNDENEKFVEDVSPLPSNESAEQCEVNDDRKDPIKHVNDNLQEIIRDEEFEIKKRKRIKNIRDKDACPTEACSNKYGERSEVNENPTGGLNENAQKIGNEQVEIKAPGGINDDTGNRNFTKDVSPPYTTSNANKLGDETRISEGDYNDALGNINKQNETKDIPVGRIETKPSSKKSFKRKLSLKKTTSHSDSLNDEDIFISTPKEDPVYNMDNAQIVEEILTLEKSVQNKEMQLQKLQQARIYRNIHKLGDLEIETNTWKTGCEEALRDLLKKLNEHASIDMNALLSNLKMPPNLFRYDVEGDRFLC